MKKNQAYFLALPGTVAVLLQPMTAHRSYHLSTVSYTGNDVVKRSLDISNVSVVGCTNSLRASLTAQGPSRKRRTKTNEFTVSGSPPACSVCACPWFKTNT